MKRRNTSSWRGRSGSRGSASYGFEAAWRRERSLREAVRAALAECLEPRRLFAADLLEPNDSFQEAWELGTVEGAFVEFDLSVEGNDDFFRFGLAADGGAEDAVFVSFAHAHGDLDLELYDASGQFIAESDGQNNLETVSLAGLPAGSYVVRVFGFEGADNPAYDLEIQAPFGADPVDNNDTQGAATPLGTVTGPATFDGLSISPENDVDFYSFTTTGSAGPSHAVAIAFEHDEGDLDLEVLRGDGSRVGLSQSVTDAERVSLDGLPAGTYFVRVYGYQGTTNPDYVLTIDAPGASTATIAPDVKEANDSLGQAANLGTASGTLDVPGLTIHDGTDVDFFRFTIAGSGTAAHRVEVLFPVAAGDLDAQLLDESGDVLATADGVVDNETLSLQDLPAGTYVLRVFGFQGATNAYAIKVTAPEAPDGGGGPGPAGDAFEPNNSGAAATELGTLNAPVAQQGLSVHQSGDEDFFRFTLPAPGSAGQSARITFAHAEGDLDFQLLDASGATVLETSNGVTDAESVSLEGRAAGAYVLRVFGYNGATNAYALAIDAVTGGPAAGGPDAYEPQEPIRINQNQTLSNLSVHDPASFGGQGTLADLFAFTTTGTGGAGDFVSITFTHANGDLALALLDANGTPLATSNGQGNDERISLSGLAAGSYQVRVDGAPNPNYSFSIAAPFTTNGGGNPQVAPWTVLVYVDGDNNLEGAALDDINEMESALLGRGVQVGVWLDRIPGEDNSDGNWTDTRQGVIGADSNPNAISSPLQSIGERNFGDPQTLTDFLSWGMSTLPAQNFAVILWDHGGATSGVAFDDTSNNDSIVPGELAAVLAAAPQRVDVLGFDACLMATAEVLHDVRAHADFMVASEEVEGGDGWDYTAVLNAMGQTPNASPEQVASLFVQQAPGTGSDIVTLSAARGGEHGLSGALANFAAAARSASAADAAVIRSARNAAPGYEYSFFRDLGAFATQVANNASGAALRSAAGAVGDALRATILTNFSTPRAGGTGLTIHLPAVGEGLTGNYRSLAFDAATGWSTFLNDLFGRAGGGGGQRSAILQDVAENNDTRLTAYDLHRLSGPALPFFNYTLHHGGDVDWFRFQTGTGGAADDNVSIAFDGSRANLDLALFDADGVQLEASGADVGNAESVSLDDLPEGQYFFRVTSRDGAAASPDYDITIDAPSFRTGDWAEDNNTLAKARPLRIGDRNGGLTLGPGDVDHFLFDVSRLPDQENPVVVTVEFAEPTQGLAVTLDVLDAAGNVLASGVRTGARLEVTQPGLSDEQFVVRVAGDTGGSVIPYELTAAHVIPLLALAGQPTVSVAAASGAEGGTAGFVVTLSEASAEAITVDYATAAAGSAAAGADFFAAVGTLTFAPGETSKTVAVTLLGDAELEQSETFTLALSNPTGGGVLSGGAASATGTIIDVAPVDAADLAIVDVLPVFKGAAGAALLGGAARGKATVLLRNDGTLPFNGTAAVRLVLSADAVPDDGDTTVFTLPPKALRLRPGQAKALKASFTLPAVADGNYVLLAVADPSAPSSGGPQANDFRAAPSPLNIRAPFVDLAAGTVVPPAALLFPFSRAKASVLLRNDGNVPARGLATVTLFASADPIAGNDDDILVATLSPNVNLKPGAAKAVKLNFTLPDLPPGGYFLVTSVQAPAGITDTNVSNNRAISGGTFDVL